MKKGEDEERDQLGGCVKGSASMRDQDLPPIWRQLETKEGIYERDLVESTEPDD